MNCDSDTDVGKSAVEVDRVECDVAVVAGKDVVVVAVAD